MLIVVPNIITNNLINPVLSGGSTINQEPLGAQTTVNTTDAGPNPKPNLGQNAMPIVVPNIITNNLIDPVLSGGSTIGQEPLGAQTTVNTTDAVPNPKPNLNRVQCRLWYQT